jgi:phosphoribosylformylglycinamidine synthase
MMVRIEVKLKSGHFDPEGDVTAKSLRDLGFPVSSVRVSKVYTVELDANSREKAMSAAREMCRKLLANPTKDDFFIEVLAGEGGTD